MTSAGGDAAPETRVDTTPRAAGDLVLCRGRLELVLRPADGGRLARLRYDGVDLVLPPGQPHGIYGDTFWPSPQSRFEWPPPPTLDAGPYAVVSRSARSVVLSSEPDETVGLQAVKELALTADGVDFAFTLTNVWPHDQRVAPWQVTRAAREGLLVWAEGAAFTDADRVVKHREDPPCWFRHADLPGTFEGFATAGTLASIAVPAVTRTSKYFTDARGWLAHLHRGILVLRRFPDLTIDEVAPRQAELELYVDLERDYIEMENQGAYVTLTPGASVRYRTQWFVDDADPVLATDRVTPELVAAIAALAGRGGADLTL